MGHLWKLWMLIELSSVTKDHDETEAPQVAVQSRHAAIGAARALRSMPVGPNGKAQTGGVRPKRRNQRETMLRVGRSHNPQSVVGALLQSAGAGPNGEAQADEVRPKRRNQRETRP